MHVKLWEAWIKPPDSRKSSRILFDLWVNVHRSALAIRQQRLLSNAGSHHSTQSRAYHTEYDSAAWWDRLLPSTTIACVFTRQRGITLSKQEDVKKSAGTLLFTRRTSLHRHFRFSSPLSNGHIKEWLSTLNIEAPKTCFGTWKKHVICDKLKRVPGRKGNMGSEASRISLS